MYLCNNISLQQTIFEQTMPYLIYDKICNITTEKQLHYYNAPIK